MNDNGPVAVATGPFTERRGWDLNPRTTFPWSPH
jgi:hypothetical protein